MFDSSLSPLKRTKESVMGLRQCWKQVVDSEERATLEERLKGRASLIFLYGKGKRKTRIDDVQDTKPLAS